jgi:GntR family transcriptional regulator
LATRISTSSKKKTDGGDPQASPLHAQIAQYLREQIKNRSQGAGTMLAGEAALCRQFEVSRSVARQALETLEREGLIRRERGQPPVVADTREHHRMVQSSTGLFEQFSALGLNLQTQVQSLQPVTPTPDVAAFFGAEPVLQLERLRSLDGVPLAFVRTWLPAALLPDLLPAHLTNTSLHHVLRSRYGLQPLQGRNRIRAVAADAAMAVRLEVSAGSPLLQLQGEMRDQWGRALECFTTWHRPENLVFDVDVHPGEQQVQAVAEPVALMPSPRPEPAEQEPSPLAPPDWQALEATLEQALLQVRAARQRP